MRKLASIQRIWKIEPVEGADRIELAYVLGWKCVVNKGQFAPMDLAVYFEIDSFLPLRPEFEFLKASSYKKTDVMGEGYRLRTMSFKGQISQGLVLPLSLFPQLPQDAEPGRDVTGLLGVKKWEILEKATTGGTVVGTLPKEVPHTDETRIQAEPGLLECFGDLDYYISTKMDGSSHSVCVNGEGFHVTGHNYEYKDDGTSPFYEYVKREKIKEKAEGYAKDNGLQSLTIQGEFCAPGIQKNRLRLIRPEWYVFTVLLDGERVGLEQMEEICRTLALTMVPVEERGRGLKDHYPTVEAVLKRAEGEYPKGGRKEGIVIRPQNPVYCPLISAPLSLKAVNNLYLLKE